MESKSGKAGIDVIDCLALESVDVGFLKPVAFGLLVQGASFSAFSLQLLGLMFHWLALSMRL